MFYINLYKLLRDFWQLNKYCQMNKIAIVPYLITLLFCQVLSQSPPHSLISCDQKSDTERWLEYCSSSPMNQHSSDSRHSSANRTSRELRSQRSRSPHRRERSHGSSDRSPRLQKGQHSSDSRHSRASHASRELHTHRSRSPHRRERSRGSSNLSPCRQEHNPRFPQS